MMNPFTFGKIQPMRHFTFILLILLVACSPKAKQNKVFTSVEVEVLYQDSISIRAIEIMDGSLAFAGNNGIFGTVDLQTGTVRSGVQAYDSILPEYRAIAHTQSDFFMLSAGNPALLYKTGDRGQLELVWSEEGEGVFYDAMAFWNNAEGIAIGDSREGCLAVLITRDGGQSWKKIPCEELPPALEGEGAFAASNTNIAIVGDTAWVATTRSRIFRTQDKGVSWEVIETPVVQKQETEGIYSVAFYDARLGIVIGGDYTQPEMNRGNKAFTRDGGSHWELIADGTTPGYKSCIQFVPNSGWEELVAVGYTGISYSSNAGTSWKDLADEPFYTIRFLNDSVAYAAGRNRIAKLTFQ